MSFPPSHPPVDSTEYYDINNKKYSTSIIILPNGFTRRGVFELEEVRQAFLACATEYEASQYFTTHWEHWKQVVEAGKTKKYIENIRQEKKLKDKAEARKLLWESARKGNVAAQKAVYELEQEDIKEVRRLQKQQEEDSIKEAQEKEAVEAIRNSLKIVDIHKKKESGKASNSAKNS